MAHFQIPFQNPSYWKIPWYLNYKISRYSNDQKQSSVDTRICRSSASAIRKIWCPFPHRDAIDRVHWSLRRNNLIFLPSNVLIAVETGLCSRNSLFWWVSRSWLGSSLASSGVIYSNGALFFWGVDIWRLSFFRLGKWNVDSLFILMLKIIKSQQSLLIFSIQFERDGYFRTMHVPQVTGYFRKNYR